MDQWTNIGVKESIKKMLVDDCKREYIKHHPELEETKITDNKILFEVCKFYLEND